MHLIQVKKVKTHQLSFNFADWTMKGNTFYNGQEFKGLPHGKGTKVLMGEGSSYKG